MYCDSRCFSVSYFRLLMKNDISQLSLSLPRLLIHVSRHPAHENVLKYFVFPKIRYQINWPECLFPFYREYVTKR